MNDHGDSQQQAPQTTSQGPATETRPAPTTDPHIRAEDAHAMVCPPSIPIVGGKYAPLPQTDEKSLSQRFTHHPPQGDQADRYTQVRAHCLNTARAIVALTPPSPEQSRALNALDEVMFLANAAIARHG